MRGNHYQLNQKNNRCKLLKIIKHKKSVRKTNNIKMNGLTPFKNKKVYRNIQKLTIKINKVKKNKLFVLIQINQLI